ncbi:hypothetical protein HWV62_20114 [Athelia sp. TMB]|nr:hypothetical protein HWV62_31789 [Athelia sp. TMB]KAF7971677.1 hypothetical protein HWV62_20114 [Athelia sp. TMB]
MPPPSDHPSLHIKAADGLYFVTKLSPGSPIPQVFLEALGQDSGRFLSITRTAEEISIVGEVQDKFPIPEEDSSWKAFRLQGPFPFDSVPTEEFIQIADLTGILNSLITPLKDAEIGIFALSTL